MLPARAIDAQGDDDAVLGEGLLDRLLNSAYVIRMLGQSYRPKLWRRDLRVANKPDQSLGK